MEQNVPKEMIMSNLSYISTRQDNVSQVSEDVIAYSSTQQNAMDIDLLNDIHQSKAGTYVSEETYWDLYYEDKDYRYEWNNGVLEIKDMPTIEIVHCARWLILIMEQFLEVNPIAQIIFLDIGFRLDLSQKTSVRKPDCAIISNDNPVQPDKRDRSYKGIYDICIEYVSDSKPQYIIKDTVERKREYCQAQVKEYYVIDDINKNTNFYTLDTHGNYEEMTSENGIIRSTVLPGFQFRIDDLYRQPELMSLIDDPVYQSYIKKDFQEERKAKELALKELETVRLSEQKAQQEKQAAIEENKRLKQLLNSQQQDSTI